MSRQDDILGPHPSKHPVFGTWLDYEDKESTETSCVRTLSEKSVFDDKLICSQYYPFPFILCNS